MNRMHPDVIIYHHQKAVYALELTALTKIIPLYRFRILKLPEYETVWCMNPWYYTIHNNLHWKFLVFDYDDPANFIDHWFYKSVFSKHLVFLYVRSSPDAHPTMYSFQKDHKGVYKSKIWTVIRRLNTKRNSLMI